MKLSLKSFVLLSVPFLVCMQCEEPPDRTELPYYQYARMKIDGVKFEVNSAGAWCDDVFAFYSGSTRNGIQNRLSLSVANCAEFESLIIVQHPYFDGDITAPLQDTSGTIVFMDVDLEEGIEYNYHAIDGLFEVEKFSPPYFKDGGNKPGKIIGSFQFTLVEESLKDTIRITDGYFNSYVMFQ